MAAYSEIPRADAGNHYDAGSNAHAHQSQAKQTSFPQLSRKFVARRISEGETGRLKEELKCQACGKGYKHVSSLAKHLWEHTPEWNVTSKLLISKHQQVQLLEAASILVSMNDEDKPSDASDDDKDADPAEFESRIRDALSRRDRAKAKDRKSESEGLVSSPGPSHGDSQVPSQASSNASSAEPADAAMDAAPLSVSVPASAPIATPLTAPNTPGLSESAVDDLTPARDIPILSAKPIAKTPRYSHRRLSVNAGSLDSLGLGSLGTSMGRNGREMMLKQASPLPESVLAKDHAHHPPHRRRRQSTLVASVPRDAGLDLDEDGLQDPEASPDNDAPNTPKESPGHSPRKNAGSDDVFGLEV